MHPSPIKLSVRSLLLYWVVNTRIKRCHLAASHRENMVYSIAAIQSRDLFRGREYRISTPKVDSTSLEFYSVYKVQYEPSKRWLFHSIKTEYMYSMYMYILCCSLFHFRFTCASDQLTHWVCLTNISTSSFVCRLEWILQHCHGILSVAGTPCCYIALFNIESVLRSQLN